MSLHNYSKIPQVSFHFLNLMALRQLSATASRITGKLRDSSVLHPKTRNSFEVKIRLIVIFSCFNT